MRRLYEVPGTQLATLENTHFPYNKYILYIIIVVKSPRLQTKKSLPITERTNEQFC